MTGINLVGHISGDYGLGEAARSTIRALTSVNIPVYLQDIRVDVHSNTDLTYQESIKGELKDNAINLLHINPNVAGLRTNLASLIPPQGIYNIGFWMCELETLPKRWCNSFSCFDEIWTASRFCQDSIARVSPIPVIRIPHSIEKKTVKIPRSSLGWSHDTFIFLYIFDFWSSVERKNPYGLVEAFQKAFPDGKKNARLVIKCSSSSYFKSEFQELKKLIGNSSNIEILSCNLPRNELDALIAHCNCYVSLHRSEGFGLTIAEAMAWKKPVIVTGYSGNLDFTNINNSLLVPYKMIPVQKSSVHHSDVPDAYWAEPDLDVACQLMRDVVDYPEKSNKLAMQASSDIHSMLSSQVIGKLITERLSIVRSFDQSYNHKNKLAWKETCKYFAKESTKPSSLGI